MKYVSTRDTNAIKEKISAAEAICRGLAPDGGLYVPETLPSVTLNDVKALAGRSYVDRAAILLSLFFEDFTLEELQEMCASAYSDESFPDGAAPMANISDNIYSLELWHGPTCAFKDMALQLMPRLFTACLKKTGETRRAHILVATSGDTGKAALEGYRDVDGVSITVFYPETGVSRVQKMQMMTQEGENVSVCAIRGNFDDAQNGVKRIFSDADIKEKLNEKGVFLSSANSINWGRLAPQIVYYFSAYCDLYAKGLIELGERIHICVPTGNFGNILAAYIAKRMGLPVSRLVCASNSNKVLTDFIKTGVYDRNRAFFVTMSPSMDILISSNLERLLYFTAGPEATAEAMKSLNETGRYSVSEDILAMIREDFRGYNADEELTVSTVKRLFKEYGYLSDTHTAVAFSAAERYIEESGSAKAMVICSTASPYKFAADVYHAVSGDVATNSIAALGLLSKYTETEIPTPLKKTLVIPVRFERTIDACDMEGELGL